MSHFAEIAHYRPVKRAAFRRDLFTGQTELTLHDSDLGHAEVDRFFLGAASFGRVVSTGHDVALSEHLNATLLVPVRGAITSDISQRTFEAAAGQALLFSPNERRTRVTAPKGATFLAVPVVFSPREIDTAASRIGVLSRKPSLIGNLALRLDPTRQSSAGELIQTVRLILSEIERGSPRLKRADAQSSWLDLLTEKIVEVLSDADMVDLPAAHGGRPAYRHVGLALDYMHTHFADIETTSEIAEVCGISIRALEQAFTLVLSDTPRSVLNAIRLDEARRMLLSGAGEVSVTEVAHACGLSHPGRFASAYRKRFGELPSVLARRSV